MGDVPHEIQHQVEPTVAADVAAALAAAGRTEDLRFSPDGRRLAIAGFARRSVVLVDVVVEPGDRAGLAGPSVTIEGVVVATTDLRQPHGLDWLDHETLVVGDRDGGLALLPVPPRGTGVRTVDVATVPVATAPDLLKGPGSVAVAGPSEVLVAGNWADVVTRHRLAADDPGTVVDEDVWLRRGLDLPDGLAVSADGRWVAVSNHNEQVVLVYDRTEGAGPDDREPAGILRGARYPHGLRFTADGGHLLVADAGSPTVLAFAAPPGGGWRTAAYPEAAIRVLGDDLFAAGHRRADEGGPKGIDVDPSGRVLALTTEHRPLGFVDLAAALRAGTPEPAARAAYERVVLSRQADARAARERTAHDALAAEVREHDARALAARTEERAVAAEQDAAAAHVAADDARRRAEAAEHRAAAAEAHLAAIRATRLWRLADRPRRLYARLRPLIPNRRSDSPSSRGI